MTKHEKVMNIIWSCKTVPQLKTCWVFVDWFKDIAEKKMIINSIIIIALCWKAELIITNYK